LVASDTTLMVVLARATPGMRGNLVDWYANRHIPDLLSISGYQRGRLWTLEPIKTSAEPGYDTLALYDIGASEVKGALAEAAARMGGPLLPRSPALGGPNLSFLGRPVLDLQAPAAG
jgi:hypothetical protein